jgi:acetylglutamate kinase
VAGDTVDLGLVGVPVRGSKPDLLRHLVASGYVPVVACIGASRRGDLLNVNADTLASHLAAAMNATRLVIAGGTAGVLDEAGRTITHLTARTAGVLIKRGVANKGMVAKLEACRTALRQGVNDVIIADGRAVPFEQMTRRGLPGEACTQVLR